MKIAFFDTKPYDKESFNRENLKYNFEIKYFKFHLSPDTVEVARGYDVVCAFVNDEITGEIIDKLYSLGVKLIALRSAGFNNVDFQAAFGKIHVVRVPAYSPHAVAEHTIALMLTLNRKIHRAHARTREGNFSLQGFLGFDFYGKTVGVIGTGKIGKLVAQILKRGFEMEVVAYDLYPDYSWANELGVRYVPLDEMYHASEIITLNCPLTKETEHMINTESIAKMKQGVMIINTGRGKLINTFDLIEGIKSGKVGSTGLDVYEEEGEYFFEDFSSSIITDDNLLRLLSFNNAIITSHQAFFTAEALSQIAKITLQNIDEFDRNVPLSNEICYRCMAGRPCPRDENNRCF